MITAVDTNVLVALWDRDDALNSTAQAALDAAFARGKLVIGGAVFAELLALPRRTEAFISKRDRHRRGLENRRGNVASGGESFSGLRKSSSQTEVG
jgi:predicted nucleic acid-binding protein